MEPEQREAWARRLMDDPKVNGDLADDTSDPSIISGDFADAMLRRLQERADG